jgi:hypothetical protein
MIVSTVRTIYDAGLPAALLDTLMSAPGHCAVLPPKITVCLKNVLASLLLLWSLSEMARALQVFEVEDAEGPLEGTEHNIGARFGRLKVADAAGTGLLRPQMETLAEQQQTLVAQEDASATQPPGIETDLRMWRQHLGLLGVPG